MTRSVVVPDRVRRDVFRRARSIAENVSSKSGNTWLQRIEAAILKLAHDADHWPEAEEANSLGLDLRCRLVGRGRHVYRVLFLIEADSVNIVKVRHAAQDYLTEDDL